MCPHTYYISEGITLVRVTRTKLARTASVMTQGEIARTASGAPLTEREERKMKREKINEAVGRISEAHGSITRATSILDIISRMQAGNNDKPDVLLGDISNAIEILQERLGADLEEIELALIAIRDALREDQKTGQ